MNKEEKKSSIGNKDKEKNKEIKESSIVRNSVQDVQDVQDVQNEGCWTRRTLDNVIALSLFSEETLSQIFKILYIENKLFTIAELTKKIDKSEDAVRKAIQRNKADFDISKPDGKIVQVNLSKMKIEEIEASIIEYERKKEQEVQNKRDEFHRKQKSEELINEARQFFDLYRKELSSSFIQEDHALIIDFKELSEFSLNLAEEIIGNPEDTLKILESAIDDSGLFPDTTIRIINIPEDHRIFIENIRSRYIDELVFVEGRVVSITDVRPQVVNSKFECPSCGTVISVLQTERNFKEPKRCSCGRRGGFKLIDKEMIDTARVILEDLQEKTDNPYTRRLDLFIKGDLTNPKNIKMFTPGNDVKVVGILKEIPLLAKRGGISTRFDIAIEVNSVELSEEEIDVNKFSDEEIIDIQNVSSIIDREGLSEINSSFAPDIYGYEEIKNAIILQLCNKKNLPKSGGIRNKPNILIIGDPGSAKSVLGNFAVDITHGARKIVGGGSSAVGITASVIKEEDGWRVEPGAFVLAKDLLFIDELNNLQDEDKPKLQEAMSEQSVTIAKANIRMKMKVTAGALATANPIKGVFSNNEDLVKQFNLPLPIINRFDEIFITRDYINENSDEAIANKMISRDRGMIESKYSKEFLKKFFVYIKNFKEPKINKEMAMRLKKLYSKLRRYKTDSININPRVNESILRLIKASAKIRLSEEVEEKDIERAINILSESYFNLPKYDVFKNVQNTT